VRRAEKKAKLFSAERPHKDMWAVFANEAGSVVLQGWERGKFKESLY